MIPKFDTVVQQNVDRGLRKFYAGVQSFRKVPSVINEFTVEPYNSEEMDAIAFNNLLNPEIGFERADELGSGKGSVEELNTDLFGNSVLAATYDKATYDRIKVDNTLGWLSDKERPLKDYIDISKPTSKYTYSEIVDGKVANILSDIKSKENKPEFDNNGNLVTRLVVKYDPDLNTYVYKQVLADQASMQKMEAAGVALANIYGPKKYQDGLLKTGIRSIARGIANIVPDVLQFAAGTGDLLQATGNGITGNGFKSDYGWLNQLADESKALVDNSRIGKTSMREEESLFDNPYAFTAGLGQGVSSLAEYAAFGGLTKSVMAGVSGMAKGSARLLDRVGKATNLNSLRDSANKLNTVLSAEGIANESLGVIGKTINDVFVKNPELIPMVSAGLILNYGEAYQYARQMGLPLEDAATIGFITGALNTLVEQKYGANVLNKWLVGGSGAQNAAKTVINSVGGDLTKLSDKAVSNSIIGKIFDQVEKFTRVPVLGTAWEEGSEEAIQGFVKNSVESLYDQFIAPNEAVKGKDMFGTEAFGKDEWMGMLEEGTIGAILGAFGGFANSRTKEDNSIIPYIASGEFDSLAAGAKMAAKQGAITQEQYDGVMERATTLNDLYKQSKALFNEAMMYTEPNDQVQVASSLLEKLRNQQDYIQNLKDADVADPDFVTKDILAFTSQIDNALSTNATGMSVLQAFENQLRNAGINEKADLIQNARKDAIRRSNDISKSTKPSNDSERLAYMITKNMLANQIFSKLFNINMSQRIYNETRKKIQNLENQSPELAALDLTLNEPITGEPTTADQKSRIKIQNLIDEYSKTETTDEQRIKIREQLAKEIKHRYNNIRNNATYKTAMNLDQYADNKEIQDNTRISIILDKYDLQYLSGDKAKQDFTESNKAVTQAIETSNKIQEETKQRQTAEEEATLRDQQIEQELEEMYEQLSTINNDESTPNEIKESNRVFLTGGIEGKINYLNTARRNNSKRLNELSKSEQKPEDWNEIKNSLVEQNKRFTKYVNYLQSIQNRGDEFYANNERRNITGLPEDNTTYVNPSTGEDVQFDKSKTQYSNNEGYIYTDTNGVEYPEYTILNGERTLNPVLADMVSKDGVSFQESMLRDRNAQQMKSLAPDREQSYEPVAEEEKFVSRPVEQQEGEVKITEPVEKDNKHIKLLSGKDFALQYVNNPAFDPKALSVEFTLSQNYNKTDISPEAKKAADLYKKLLNSKNPVKAFEDLEVKDKQLIIYYLPIQATTYNEVSKIRYKNIHYVLAEGGTNSKFKLTPEQRDERIKLIRSLLANKGSLSFKQGSLNREGGYFNTIQGSTQNSIADIPSLGITYDNKSKQYIHKVRHSQTGKVMNIPVRIGIGTNTQIIYYEHNGRIDAARATGNPGTPYLIIPSALSLTKTPGFVMKLNPKKVDEPVARLIAKMMLTLVSSDVKRRNYLNSVIKSSVGLDGKSFSEINTFGSDVTIGQLLDDLIFWGPKTIQDREDNKYPKGYLRAKQLVIDFDENIIRYGAKLTPVDPNNVEPFVQWMIKNKNYAIDHNLLSANSNNEFGYTIKSGDFTLESDRNTPYLTRLINQGVFRTNLDPGEDANLYRQSLLYLEPSLDVTSDDTPTPLNAAQQETKQTEQQEEETPNVEGSSITITNKVDKNSGRSKWNREGLAASLASAPDGTTVTYTIDPELMQDFYPKHTFKIQDGKLNGRTLDTSSDLQALKTLRKAVIDSYNEIAGNANEEDNISKIYSQSALASISVNYPSRSTKKTTKKTTTNTKKVTNPKNPFDSDTAEGKRYTKMYNYLSSLTGFDAASISDYLTQLQNNPRVLYKNDPKLQEVFESADELYETLEDTVPGQGMNVKAYLTKIADTIVKDQPKQAKSSAVKETAKMPDTPAPSNFEQAASNTVTAQDAQELNDLAKQMGMPDIFAQFDNPSGPTMEVNLDELDTTYERSNISKEVAGYRNMVGNLVNNDVQLTDKLISTIGTHGNPVLAWAIMSKDGLTLYQGAKQGAPYHEAFHRVSLLYLSPEEREELYRQARKEYNLINNSNKEVEEYLAERFREYVLANDFDRSVTGRVKQFFKNIANFFRALFTKKPKFEDINSLFASIRNGEYRFRKQNPISVSNFDANYGKQARVPLTINGVTLEAIYDSNILEEVINTLAATTLFNNNIQRLQSLNKPIDFQPTIDYLQKCKDAYQAVIENDQASDKAKIMARQATNIYTEILNNFNNVFRPLIDIKFEGYGLRRKKAEMEDSYKEDMNTIVNDEIKSAYEFSAKENAQADVRLLFLTLRSSKLPSTTTFMNQFTNADIAWYNTFSRLHSAKSYEEMIQRLKDASRDTEQLGDEYKINMYNELLNRLENSDQQFKNRFFVTFKKHRNRFQNAYFEQTQRRGRITGVKMTFGDADINKRSRTINRQWSVAFGMSNPSNRKDELKQAISDWNKLKNKVIKGKFEFDDTVNEIIRIFSKFNITLDSPAIYTIIADPEFVDVDKKVALRNFILDIPRTGTAESKYGIQNLFSNEGPIMNAANGKVDSDKILNILGNEKSVKFLAEQYIKANPTSEDDSVIGPNGNNVYAYSEHNTITSMFEDWLKDEAYINELSSCKYCDSSVWLSQIKSSKDVRDALRVSTQLSVISKNETDTGRGYLDIAPVEDILLKFNATLNNKLPLPTLANKRTYYFIEGLKRQLVNVNKDRSKKLQLDDDTITVFMKYAINEYEVIQKAYEQRDKFLSDVGLSLAEWNNLSAAEQRQQILRINREAIEQGKADSFKYLVENYHYNTKGDKIVFENGNGYKFRYFVKLQSEVDKYGLDKVYTMYFKNPNNKKLYNYVKNSLNWRINDTIQQFINNRIIEPNSQNINYDGESIASDIIRGNILLDSDLVSPQNGKTTSEMIASVIADYAVNTAIATLEFEKLISGDLAYYKNLDDRVKRYSALTSTRQIMNIPQDDQTYRTISLNTNKLVSKVMHDAMYDKYVGTEEAPGILTKLYFRFRDENKQNFVGLTDKEIYEKAQKDADNRLSGYNDVDPTDAQVWISPTMFRKLSIMNGDWNEDKQRAFDLLESDEQLSLEQEIELHNIVMQPLKYVHFGYINSDGNRIPIYDKMSLATIFRRTAVNRDLQQMYDYMKDNDVDMIKMNSATKSGNMQRMKMYDGDWKLQDLNESAVYEQEFKYIGKQLVTDPHNVERVTFATQPIKICMSNIEKEGDYDFQGKTVKGQKLIDEYVQAIDRLSDIGKQKLFNQIGIKEQGGKLYVDKTKFVKMLRDDAINSNMPYNLIDALQTVIKSDDTTDYYIELSVLPSLNWIHSRITAMIKKATIDINTPGNAFIQMSNFGFKTTTFNKPLNTKVKGEGIIFNDELKFKRPDNGRMECIVSINLFKSVLPAEIQGDFEKSKEYILANADLFAIGYRIPTQGMNSTLPLQIVDVLRESSGDVIIMPSEITTLTGSDFDIDKMYMARYNYRDIDGKLEKIQFIDSDDYSNEEEFLTAVYNYKYAAYQTDKYKEAEKDVPKVLNTLYKKVLMNNDTMMAEDKEFLLNYIKGYNSFINYNDALDILDNVTISDTEKVSRIRGLFNKKSDIIKLEDFISNNTGKDKWTVNSREQIENRLLDIFNTTLTSDNHFLDATTPLDVTTQPIKDIVGKVDKYLADKKNISSLEALFPPYQLEIKNNNTGADAGIGPMALINTFRTFAQIAGLNLNTMSVTNDGKPNVCQLLGINTLDLKYDRNGISILDWTSALINAHVDAAKDPYITRLNVNKYTYSATAFMVSSGLGDSVFYFLPQPILRELASEAMRIKSAKIGSNPIEIYQKAWLKNTKEKYEKLLEDAIKKHNSTVTSDEQVLREDLPLYGDTFFTDKIMNKEWLESQLAIPEKQRDYNWYNNQLQILEYFNQIDEYGKSLSNLIKASQIDTAKFGNNANEMILHLHTIEQALSDTNFTNPFDIFNKTFLGKKLENSINLMFNMLSNEIIEFAPNFVNMIEQIQRQTVTYYAKDERIVNAISRELKTNIEAGFFNEYMKANNKTVKSLFYGNNSIVDRVSNLRNVIYTNQKYQNLKDNALLRLLEPGINSDPNAPKIFEVSTTKQRDTQSKNMYTYAWRDLLEHPSKEVRDIAKDLILYSFYSSGGHSNGIYNFFDLVPYEVLAKGFELNGQTYEEYMKQTVRSLNDNESYLDYATIIDNTLRSLWNNDRLIPDVSNNFIDASMSDPNVKHGPAIYLRLQEDRTNFMQSLDESYKPYVKVKDRSNVNDTLLYKFVGKSINTNGDTQLVYALIPKTGYTYKGFSIKEASNTTELPTNQVKDYTDLSVEFNKKFSKNQVKFIPAKEIIDETGSNRTYDEDGEAEVKNIEVTVTPSEEKQISTFFADLFNDMSQEQAEAILSKDAIRRFTYQDVQFSTVNQAYYYTIANLIPDPSNKDVGQKLLQNLLEVDRLAKWINYDVKGEDGTTLREMEEILHDQLMYDIQYASITSDPNAIEALKTIQTSDEILTDLKNDIANDFSDEAMLNCKGK